MRWASSRPTRRATRSGSWRRRASTVSPAAARTRARPPRSAWSLRPRATSATRGAARVRFVCGHRALDAFRERTPCLDRLAALFSRRSKRCRMRPPRTLERLAEADAQVRELPERALEGEARRLLTAAPPPRPRRPSWSRPLRRLAAGRPAHAGRAPRTDSRPCVALLGSRSDKAHLVFAQSEGLGHDVPALLRSALETSGGRGGGKGNLVAGRRRRPGPAGRGPLPGPKAVRAERDESLRLPSPAPGRRPHLFRVDLRPARRRPSPRRLVLPHRARRALPRSVRGARGARRSWPRLSRSRRLVLLLSGVALALHFATWIASLSSTSIASSVLLVNTAPLFAVGLHARLPARARAAGGPRRHRPRLRGRGAHRLRGLDGIAGIAHRQPPGAGGSRHPRRLSRDRPGAARRIAAPAPISSACGPPPRRCWPCCASSSAFPSPDTPPGRSASSSLWRSSPPWAGTASSTCRSAGCPRPRWGSSSSESRVGASLLAYFVFGEVPGPWTMAGGVLVLVALAIVLLRSD